jgi:predicted adenylyl cyclase CyaB
MATNIEIKARVRDVKRFRKLVEKISDTGETIIKQEDVFFRSPRGRLKLRVLSPSRGQLIYYERPDTDGPRPSDYFIFETSEPHSLLEVLRKTMDVRGRVRKTRSLYTVGATRIHLDEVDDLGTFAELEVVLKPRQSPKEGARTANSVMKAIGIHKSDLVSSAYIDLLEARSEAGSHRPRTAQRQRGR